MSNITLVSNIDIIRIEGSDRKGVFTSQNATTVCQMARSQKSSIHNYMKAATDIYPDFLDEDLRCAYHDIPHMAKFWDFHTLNEFIKQGFSILRLRVSKCLVHESQCLFHVDNVVSVDTVSIESIRHQLKQYPYEIVNLWTLSAEEQE